MLCDQLKHLQARSRQHKQKSIPKPLEVSTLFALAEDDDVWEDTGLDLDEEDHPPAWLADDSTRSGIKAMHIHDRAVEDILHLKEQMKALVMWLKDNMAAIRKATSQCEGKHASLFLFRLLFDYMTNGWIRYKIPPYLFNSNANSNNSKSWARSGTGS